jgi:hypothetical protein
MRGAHLLSGPWKNHSFTCAWGFGFDIFSCEATAISTNSGTWISTQVRAFAPTCAMSLCEALTNHAGLPFRALESPSSCYRFEPLAPRLAQCWQSAWWCGSQLRAAMGRALN